MTRKHVMIKIMMIIQHDVKAYKSIRFTRLFLPYSCYVSRQNRPTSSHLFALATAAFKNDLWKQRRDSRNSLVMSAMTRGKRFRLQTRQQCHINVEISTTSHQVSLVKNSIFCYVRLVAPHKKKKKTISDYQPEKCVSGAKWCQPRAVDMGVSNSEVWRMLTSPSWTTTSLDILFCAIFDNMLITSYNLYLFATIKLKCKRLFCLTFLHFWVLVALISI